jgi:hypothetical protein
LPWPTTSESDDEEFNMASVELEEILADGLGPVAHKVIKGLAVSHQPVIKTNEGKVEDGRFGLSSWV